MLYDAAEQLPNSFHGEMLSFRVTGTRPAGGALSSSSHCYGHCNGLCPQTVSSLGWGLYSSLCFCPRRGVAGTLPSIHSSLSPLCGDNPQLEGWVKPTYPWPLLVQPASAVHRASRPVSMLFAIMFPWIMGFRFVSNVLNFLYLFSLCSNLFFLWCFLPWTVPDGIASGRSVVQICRL